MADQTYALAQDGVYGQANGVYTNALGSAIPDSAILQYDANQLSGYSSGDAVDPLADFYASNDAAAFGDPLYNTDAQNGNAIVDYDGTDDRHGTDLTDISQPFTSITVISTANQTGSVERVWGYDASGDNDVDVYSSAGDKWAIYAGGSALSGGTTAPPLILTAIFDGSNSRIRENGTQTVTGDPGSAALQSISMAGDADGRYFEMGLGEQLIYDADLEATGDLGDEEQRLSDKWGIAI